MKILAAILWLGVTAAAVADTVRVTAGGQLRIPGDNVTAAYSLDTDCAEVKVEAGAAIVTGRRPCATHIVTVARGLPTEREVLVLPRQSQLDRLRAARLMQRGIQQTGYTSTLYSSDPGQIETTFSMARTEGGHTASMSLSVANGYAFSSDRRKTALPLASLRFSGPSGSLTLLDSFVEQSPLTLYGTDLRGLHVQRGPWFMHAGIASLTNFRFRMFDPDPDRTVDAGYRFSLTRHSGFVASTQWIRASSRYASGRSGVIGSLMYDYQNPGRLRFQAELGLSRNLAGAALLDYLGAKDRLQLRMRTTPLSFPGLSAAPARGFQGNGNWNHQLTSKLDLEVSGSRDTYGLPDGSTQANTFGNGRLQWRINRFTFSGGFDHSELSRRSAPAIVSDSVPVGIAFDSRHFGNSIQYQIRRNRSSDQGSYLVRDSVRFNAGAFRMTLYAARQTQAPTVDFVVTNVPGLRQALLAAGITATTSEEILDFLRTHADLLGGGVITGLNLNLAPVRMEYGGTFRWTVRRNLLSIDVGYRAVDDKRILEHVGSKVGSTSASLHLTHSTTLEVTGSLLETHAPGTFLRSPLVTVGLRQQIGSVPGFLNHFQQSGWIKGTVYADEDGRTAGGISNVTVVLDGGQRTLTNDSGFYYFHSVPEGMHSVEIQYQNTGAYVFTTTPSVETEANTVVNFGIGIRKAVLFCTVRNDAGIPIGGTVVHLEGARSEQVQTAETGSYRFNLKSGGAFMVSLDPQSLPPGYDLASLTPQAAKVEVNEPARVNFVVRALRSVYGKVSCTGAPLDTTKVALSIDGAHSGIAVDKDGRYKITALASGWHELTINYDAVHLNRRIELPEEPATLGSIDFEVCAATYGQDPEMRLR